MKKVYIIIAVLVLYFGYTFLTSPKYTNFYGEINCEADPIQENIDGKKDEIIFGKYKITKMAKYKISAVVVSKKDYSYGTESNFSPVDTALAWGKMSEKENIAKVRFSQSGRWYFYEYQEFPLGKEYIATHSSNHHLVPANSNLKKAVKRIKKGDKVVIDGYLISITGENYFWNSSLTRNDTGNGACEIVYVEKLIINKREYN